MVWWASPNQWKVCIEQSLTSPEKREFCQQRPLDSTASLPPASFLPAHPAEIGLAALVNQVSQSLELNLSLDLEMHIPLAPFPWRTPIECSHFAALCQAFCQHGLLASSGKWELSTVFYE